MTSPSPYAKDLGNLLYHSAIVGGRSDIEDSAKLVGTVALALWTKHMLVKQGIISKIITINT